MQGTPCTPALCFIEQQIFDAVGVPAQGVARFQLKVYRGRIFAAVGAKERESGPAVQARVCLASELGQVQVV